MRWRIENVVLACSLALIGVAVGAQLLLNREQRAIAVSRAAGVR